ncbi:type VI secretion system ATPase TssH [Acinetobacter populi]|uniref:ClpV1 family T6SS ATPase n=1 Tax=Acinetobacter populi TaxID=1582270 RepID=A0A1Z9Z191_9GAMM|nr:type VI secretion system ATPase TssH [Acinetobacter populi]OUY08251.1 ClpV1 family T6SS ATPase [Acinetobacter populi]
MSEINRSALFSKLNKSMYKSLENAFFFTKLRENKYVELSHWIYQILQVEQSDLFFIQNYFEINQEQLQQDIEQQLNVLKNGYTEVSDFSEDIIQFLEEAWLYCSLKFNATEIRGAYLLYTLLTSNQFKNQIVRLSSEFAKIKPEQLLENMAEICANSIEHAEIDVLQSANQINNASGQSALAKFGTNLTQQARDNKLDPVTARDDEIRQMIDILLRKRQNNPLLTGEAGVGKTAVVEGLALKIAEEDVPPSLQDVEIILLDIGALKAGASVSGEFENRLKSVIREVHQSVKPIILFIDEIHTLIGAGGAAGTADAANLLKPALARGELRTIGATTWAEYKKYFEKDPALTRRFQVVQVGEPSEDIAINMLRALTEKLEQHHQVIILDEAIESAVKLSKRYIPARQLPDKAIGILDTACARVAVSLSVNPIRLKQLQQEVSALELQQQHLLKQQRLGYPIKSQSLEALQETLSLLEQEQAELTQKFEQEKSLVDQLRAIRNQLNSPSELQQSNKQELEQLLSQQQLLLSDLRQIQQDQALIFPVVNAGLIAEIIGEWTGIPVGKMIDDEIHKVLHLTETLNQRVIGQKHGLQTIVKRIQTSRAQLDDPNKPIGVFMLAGPSGVGKTETALALADAMYGGEHNLITINMSEYQEPHTVSTLKGAPPGYVGYGEGGVLTEAVRRKPYSVILLDEIEKAHPDVHEIFFQVFDKGWMEDGEGRYIDFKNTVILLTTNVGSDLVMNLCEDEDLKPDVEGLQHALREPLLKVFPAALLGRIQTIPYYPLSSDMMNEIIKLQLNRIVDRILINHDIRLTYDENVLNSIIARCNEIESGGRMINSIISNTILPELSLEILSRTGTEDKISEINIGIESGKFNYQFL